MNEYLANSNTVVSKINGKDYFGELKKNSSEYSLTLWGHDIIVSTIGYQLPKQLHCTFKDLKKATLIGLFTRSNGCYSKEHSIGNYQKSYFCEIYPSHIIIGDRHIDIYHKFESLVFVTSHSTKLFHDSLSFRTIIHSSKERVAQLIKEDLEESRLLYGYEFSDNEIRVGERPILSLYSGADEICTFTTNLGNITIRNNPEYSFPSSHGYSLENKVSCSIKFSQALSFEEANKQLQPVKSVFELIIGCKLKVIDYQLHSATTVDDIDIYNVHENFASNTIEDVTIPHPAQRLISIETDKTQFISVVTNWLAKADSWNNARWQFFSAFFDKNYSTDRLIKSANMFDIIPDKAYGKKTLLEPELEQAKNKCREIFRNLPDSIERQSILGALGRIGTKTLKHKIRMRADIILQPPAFDMAEIDLVIAHSVDCRNYFVHGGTPKFDYYENFDLIIFFTDTLNFIYGVSELIEAGWSLTDWLSKRPMHHPFKNYLDTYNCNLTKLKSIVP